MPITPTAPSTALASSSETSEHELVELLKAALAPSFVLIRKIGEGGMGTVYLARDPALKRLVAVKVLSPRHAADEYARARFEREAEAVAAISHPNVVAVHSVGELANGIPYLVMQYVDGPSMAERLAADGPLDLETAKTILGQVAAALAAAQRKGIIHRDIKAANILWDDSTGRALVSDFGIAAVLERNFNGESLRITQTGMIVGTPAYMSPEQFLGEQVTDKTDVYSLGLLGYELLTGEGPYLVTSPRQLPAAHLRDAPRTLSAMRPDVEPELEALLAKCLEKTADLRPTAEELSRRMARGASVLIEWPPPGLEALHGALRARLSMFVSGALAFVVPLLIASTAAEDSMFRFPMPQVVIWPLLAAIGDVIATVASFRIAKLYKSARLAARAGYGWGTIAEVLVDDRHDTGALIAGEKEYAALSPERRDHFRRTRIVREALRLGAGLWLLTGFLVGLPLVVRLTGSPTALVLWALGIPLAMLGTSALLEAREASALSRVRRRTEPVKNQVDRLSGLAASWRQSFEQLMSGGRRMGQGVFGWRKRIRALAEIAGVVVVTSFVSVVVMLVPITAQVFLDITSLPSEDATKQYQDIVRMKRYAAPIDASVTPVRAGQALHDISLAGGRPPLSRFERRAVDAIPKIRQIKQSWGPFTKNWIDRGAMDQARRGLNPAQRQFLIDAANEPGLSEFHVVASAASVDFLSAAVVQPLPPTFNQWMIPRLDARAIETVAYSRIAQAAIDLADGRPAVAERSLREVIGFGLAVTDSRSLWDGLVGMKILRRARANLVSLYEATGRSAEAAAIASDVTAGTSYYDYTETSDMRMTPEARAIRRQHIIIDTMAPIGLRWEVVTRHVAFEPCGDLRQMIFGPDKLQLVRLAEARRVLVKSPSDDIRMRLAENALATPIVLAPGFAIGPRPLYRLVSVLDAMTGSHRFSGCLMNPNQMIR